MQELLLAVARGLVEDKDAVKVTVDEPREDGTIVYHLSVAEGDMGRVIGKQGRIAKAIRVVMRAAAVRVDEKVLVEVEGGFFVCNFERSVSGRCEPVCHSFIGHSENEVEMFPET